ncbi:DUF559 domain-containing protein [Pelotalea chapellei]|uniref:DUF559 domain-containing protein n=1 Tax=Pelotalea chapellei TaxID=44671 RepID=A0ABS5UCP8_9BACT|nr:DUF559 domain-containing protein [Pelotalea chapellei]MBT1073467.1 DUF559 domain-containing protein [Pelotalea chapellei]
MSSANARIGIARAAYVIEAYIVDFVSFDTRIIIELDGG